jgi:CRP-like cAMP-binding protein
VTRLPIAVLCADEDHENLSRLRDALVRIVGPDCLVEGFRNGGRLGGRIRQLQEDGFSVPVVFVDETLMDEPGVDALLALHDSEHGRAIRKVLIAGGVDPGRLGKAIRAGALNGTVTKPWTDLQLRGSLGRLLTEFYIETDPIVLERIPGLVDVGVLAHAFALSEDRAKATRDQLDELRGSFFADDDLDDDAAEQAMIDEIDRALGHPERQTYPAGTTLLRSGDPATGVLIVLDGTVRLYRAVDGEEVTVLSRMAGRIVGLLAMARTRPAFYSCDAVTDVEVIPVSFDELSEAMHRSPTLAVRFVSLLVRSLARRNVITVELQVERDGLVRDLAAARAEADDLRRRLAEAESAAEAAGRE